MCNFCEFGTRCCKIIPPMIFEFERPKFEGKLITKEYRGYSILLLKKKGSNCIFLKQNKCLIYSSRPFNCKLFPFDITKKDNKFYWILWDFCYKPNDIEKNLKNFEKVIRKISKKELDIYIYHLQEVQNILKVELLNY